MEETQLKHIDIERYRFAHYQPQAIESMVLSHDKQLLAVARENKSIEIWSVPNSWSQILVIPGNKNCDIRNLHWYEPNAVQSHKTSIQSSNPLYYETTDKKLKKRRLVTTGLNGVAIEWNLQTMTPKAKYNNHSAIWDSKISGKHLYLATEEGTIKILKLKKNKIEFVKSLLKMDSKCLSLELIHNPSDKSVKYLFSGYADSSIRKWDIANNNSILQFQKQSGKASKKQGECSIWKLKAFKNFLISGDSQGEVTIWDQEFGTMVKAFKNLRGDINTIEINNKFNSVYATGADSRILVIQLKEEKQQQEWIFSSIFRGQSHDINSLALLSNKQLISGGLTTDICVYNLIDGRFADQFGKNSKHQSMTQKLRHIPPFPFKQISALDNESIVMLNGNMRNIDVYSNISQQQLLKIEKKGDYNIQAFDKKGQYIVYADTKDTQVFYFDSENLIIKKLTKKISNENGLQAIPSALYLQIYQDEANEYVLLVIDFNLNVLTVNISGDLKVNTVLNIQEIREKQNIDAKIRSYDKIINFAHYNATSSLLFISFLDLHAFVMIDLTTKNLEWQLPILDNDIPLCCSCDGDKLVVAYDSNKIAVYDLKNKKLHDWSLRNLKKIPQNFLNRYNRIIGITQIDSNKYLLYTNYTYITLDLSQDIVGDEVQIVQNHPGKSITEKSIQAQTWFDNLKLSQAKYLKGNQEQAYENANGEKVQNLTISNKIKGILKMDYDKESNKLRVIENTWKKVLEAFPGTVAIPKYGQ